MIIVIIIIVILVIIVIIIVIIIMNFSSDYIIRSLSPEAQQNIVIKRNREQGGTQRL